MAESRLDQLSARGQSVWIDYLSRDLLETGELKRMMEEDAVVGVTSNPTIFQKALSQGDAYDEQLKMLEHETDTKEIFLHLAVRDVENALDLLAPVHERRRAGRLRVDRGRPEPRLRHEGDLRRGDPPARVDPPAEPLRQDPRRPSRACRRSRTASRPAGASTSRSCSRCRCTASRWRPTSAGSSASSRAAATRRRCGSVASFFVSRVDTETDKRLEAIGSEEALALRGKLAIANAKLAYERYQQAFSGRALGGTRSARERCRSAAYGLLPRRRTPRTATSSTSRS